MEYLAYQITPTGADMWRASGYIKATMPAIHGHPRTLRTLPELLLPGARGFDVGSLAAVMQQHLDSLGALPLCGLCGSALAVDGDLP